MNADHEARVEMDLPCELMIERGVCADDVWTPLVRGVRAGDRSSLNQLYIALRGIYTHYFRRKVGPEFSEDAVHELFLLTTRALRDGGPTDPSQLMSYIRGIAKNQTHHLLRAKIERTSAEWPLDQGTEPHDQRFSSDELALEDEKHALIRACLERLKEKQREILERFYLREETAAQICLEMNLTEHQFRLLKSRAKRAFGEVGRRQLKPSGRSPGRRKVRSLPSAAGTLGATGYRDPSGPSRPRTSGS